MKKLILLLFVVAFVSCNAVDTIQSKNSDPKFRASKKTFEKELKETIPFNEMSVGTYVRTIDKVKEEGVSLTFTVDNVSSIPDSLINIYANKISEKVQKDLLHVAKYDLAIVKFQSQKLENELRKTTSVQINKKLN